MSRPCVEKMSRPSGAREFRSAARNLGQRGASRWVKRDPTQMRSKLPGLSGMASGSSQEYMAVAPKVEVQNSLDSLCREGRDIEGFLDAFHCRPPTPEIVFLVEDAPQHLVSGRDVFIDGRLVNHQGQYNLTGQ